MSQQQTYFVAAILTGSLQDLYHTARSSMPSCLRDLYSFLLKRFGKYIAQPDELCIVLREHGRLACARRMA